VVEHGDLVHVQVIDEGVERSLGAMGWLIVVICIEALNGELLIVNNACLPR